MSSIDDSKNIYDLLKEPAIENATINEFIRQTATIKKYSKNKSINQKFPLMLQIMKILISAVDDDVFNEEKEWILKNTVKKYSNLFLLVVIELKTYRVNDLEHRMKKITDGLQSMKSSLEKNTDDKENQEE